MHPPRTGVTFPLDDDEVDEETEIDDGDDESEDITEEWNRKSGRDGGSCISKELNKIKEKNRREKERFTCKMRKERWLMNDERM